MQPDEPPVVVFAFAEDGSGVDAYESLWAAWRQVEGTDVKDGEYAFITVDGRGVETTVSDTWDVTLRLTDVDRAEELRRRLTVALPREVWMNGWPKPRWLRHTRCLPRSGITVGRAGRRGLTACCTENDRHLAEDEWLQRPPDDAFHTPPAIAFVTHAVG